MRMAVVFCALGATLAGCTYQPGSFAGFARGFPGQRMTVGCLDLAVQRRADLEGAAVLEYAFGNRCKSAVPIDLERVTVVGRTIDGDEITLHPYDPRMELEPRRLDGRLAGSEALAYPATRPLVQVCADVARISDPRQPSRWVCFGSGRTDDPPPAAAPPPSELVATDHAEPDEAPNRTRIDDDLEDAP